MEGRGRVLVQAQLVGVGQRGAAPGLILTSSPVAWNNKSNFYAVQLLGVLIKIFYFIFLQCSSAAISTPVFCSTAAILLFIFYAVQLLHAFSIFFMQYSCYVSFSIFFMQYSCYMSFLFFLCSTAAMCPFLFFSCSTAATCLFYFVRS
jgi:hypothetical protein